MGERDGDIMKCRTYITRNKENKDGGEGSSLQTKEQNEDLCWRTLRGKKCKRSIIRWKVEMMVPTTSTSVPRL